MVNGSVSQPGSLGKSFMMETERSLLYIPISAFVFVPYFLTTNVYLCPYNLSKLKKKQTKKYSTGVHLFG